MRKEGKRKKNVCRLLHTLTKFLRQKSIASTQKSAVFSRAIFVDRQCRPTEIDGLY